MQMQWTIKFKRQSNQIYISLDEFKNGSYHDTIFFKVKWIPPWHRNRKGLDKIIRRTQLQLGQKFLQNKIWWSVVYSHLNHIHRSNKDSGKAPPHLKIIKNNEIKG